MKIYISFFIFTLLVLSCSLAFAERILFLGRASQSMQIRSDLIVNARSTIRAQYFTIENDSLSTGVLALLRDAALRGVKVQILVDGMHNRMDRPVMATLLAGEMAGLSSEKARVIRRNIEIKEFNPTLNPLMMTYRMHDKAMIVDDEFIVLGGRNIGNEYFEMSHLRYKNTLEGSDDIFEDIDVLVAKDLGAKKSDFLRNAISYFDDLWKAEFIVKTINLWDLNPDKMMYNTCLYLNGGLLEELNCQNKLNDSIKLVTQAMLKLDRFISDSKLGVKNRQVHVFYRKNGSDFNFEKHWMRNSIVTSNVKFLHDPVYDNEGRYLYKESPQQNRQGIGACLYQSIADNAKNEVLIVAPYFVLTPEQKELFIELKSKGVKVKILTNSRATNDSPMAAAAYELTRQDALNNGVEIIEYYPSENKTIVDEGSEMLHAKMVLIDAKLLFIGTFNWDPRSQNINRETGALIEIPRRTLNNEGQIDHFFKELKLKILKFTKYSVVHKGSLKGYKDRLASDEVHEKYHHRKLESDLNDFAVLKKEDCPDNISPRDCRAVKYDLEVEKMKSILKINLFQFIMKQI